MPVPMFYARIQRHHLEIVLLSVSSLRLCVVLASVWTHEHCAAAACLAALTVLSIVVETWRPSKQTVALYAVRRADSDGISQGVLATPSVLAALVTADPRGGWLPWLAGSSAAALSTLWQIQRQSIIDPVAVGYSNGSSSSRSSSSASRQNSELEDGCVIAGVKGGSIPARDADNLKGTGRRGAAFGLKASLHPEIKHESVPLSPWSIARNLDGFMCALCLLAAAVVLAPAFAFSSSNGMHLNRTSSSYWNRSWSSIALCSAPRLALVMGASAPACFHNIMILLPRTLSLGEGALLTQGVVLCMATAACCLQHVPQFLHAVVKATHLSGSWATFDGPAADDLLSPFVHLLVASVITASMAAWALASARRGLQGWQRAARLVTAAALAALPVCILVLLALWTLLVFVPASPDRVWILVYWGLTLVMVLPIMRLAALHKAAPQIILRKGYHLLAAILFIPAFFWDLPMLCTSLAIAFAALAAAEVLRCLHVPLLGPAVQEFMQDFVDERDAGILYVTHFTLLLGLAVPMWLAASIPCSAGTVGDPPAMPAPNVGLWTSWWAALRQSNSDRAAGTTCQGVLPAVLAGLSGMMVIGFGDTMASVVGRRYGRMPIHTGSHKTVEGTLAGTLSTLAAWWAVLLVAFDGSMDSREERTGLGVWLGSGQWVQLGLATVGACLLEACTSQLDNILIPLWYLPHCLLVTPFGAVQ